MAIEKEHKEFYTLNMDEGWEVPEGYPSGIQQKILSGRLDEENKRGHRTRLLRFLPGVYTKKSLPPSPLAGFFEMNFLKWWSPARR